jgi:hypothetical protein
MNLIDREGRDFSRAADHAGTTVVEERPFRAAIRPEARRGFSR